MRIDAGSHRGVRLATPEGRDTRPTADRARQAVFNILMNSYDAVREAKVLAGNIAATIRHAGDHPPPKLEPFVYKTLGMLASLGHYSGVGRVGPIKIRGFIAWWVWRTYYVMQMTRWERRLRVILDWTVALLFKNDIVKLDLFGEEHPTHKKANPPPEKVAADTRASDPPNAVPEPIHN